MLEIKAKKISSIGEPPVYQIVRIDCNGNPVDVPGAVHRLLPGEKGVEGEWALSCRVDAHCRHLEGRYV